MAASSLIDNRQGVLKTIIDKKAVAGDVVVRVDYI